MSSNVFVAGGTGTAGRAYTQALLDAGFNVKVTVRPGSDAKGLLSKQVVPCEVDLRNEEDVIHAVKGSDYVFISLLGRGDKMAEDEEKITRNVVHAAKLARVKRIVYTSVYLADRKTGVAHFEIKGKLEEAIRASGIPHTILRPTTFMDAFNTPWIRGGIEDKGVLANPISIDAVISYVYTGDLARIAVSTLNKPDYDGVIVELGGPEALTYKKILATMNELAGSTAATI
jgi:uncharacterized protein YbjT (DUF2867 family)